MGGDGDGLTEQSASSQSRTNCPIAYCPLPDLLPDLLFPHPRLIFIGTAAGAHSARAGAYYANPSNKFWRTLHMTNITPHLFAPHDFPQLATLNIGLTDLCKTESGMDHQIRAFDVEALRAKLAQAQPEAVAFTSKKGASLYLGRPTAALAYGLQAKQENQPLSFVLPSPSGAAGASWSIAPWQTLADWFHQVPTLR